MDLPTIVTIGLAFLIQGIALGKALVNMHVEQKLLREGLKQANQDAEEYKRLVQTALDRLAEQNTNMILLKSALEHNSAELGDLKNTLKSAIETLETHSVAIEHLLTVNGLHDKTTLTSKRSKK